MAHAVRPLSGLASRLNTDGKAHPIENTFAMATILLGVVSFATGLVTAQQWANLHLLASWTGLAGILTGGWGQFISATTAERFLLIVGFGGACVGLFLGIAFGGPFGGVLG